MEGKASGVEAGLVGVGGDGLIDFEGEGEGGAAGLCRDPGLGAGLDGVEEVFKLEAERLGAGEVELFESEAGGGMGGGRRG